MHETRTRALNDAAIRRGRYVLYWMQASQRAVDNPALDVAVELGNSMPLPVLCVFGLAASYPDANLRHYAFMLEGLRETKESLENQGIWQALSACRTRLPSPSLTKRPFLCVTADIFVIRRIGAALFLNAAHAKFSR